MADAVHKPAVPDRRPAILITGVSGLIGTWVARDLARDFDIVGLDIQPPQSLDGVDFIECDLTDDGAVRKALTDVREQSAGHLASVLHLAAYYDFSGEPSPLYQELTVNGTKRLLEELRNFERVEQFVFSSSLLVMQPSEEGKHISELSPTRAEWAYPQSKLDAEEVIRRYHGEVPYVILRLAGVYDEDCHSLPVSQQIARIYERQLEGHFFPGDPKRGQALVHLQDLTECFRKTVEHRSILEKEELFLIAEPDVMSYGELQDRIGERLYDQEWTTIRIPKVVAKAGAWAQSKLAGEEDRPFIKPWMVDLADDHYAPTIAHARAKLSWDPSHRLRDTLDEMIDRLKADPAKWYAENKLSVSDDLKHKS